MKDRHITIKTRFCIKSTNSNGDLGKQYFFVLSEKGKEDILLIKKLVLVSKDYHIFEKMEFTLLKTFKNYKLYIQTFSIKMDTLVCAIFNINESLKAE